ncbi:Cobalt-zinc-cadmium resistance protein CzcA; Cation efflux system protein CusA [Collimonas arenae]|uniref:Cobalt-zinc-cadmium resistance protein CzcA Cation efflux system protein CusA n=1 Tax=Collimonas arenae TaxID=279058 RepID=A0A0A1FE94_9BURK|nr:efflux RND transporter permease subunit [Collimonas arenae]AIY42781.1 Cobalt-zinc-cadmium resistance protein CzcA; Cation efflux system protein CusA [Collimonas arenae]
MNISRPFIERPIATTLLTIGVALAGMVAFRLLPVSPLPQVDFPTISISAGLPGASPETMAATVATPLERALGSIAGVTEMTSSSSLSSTRITMQFDLSRDIDGAARDVQAALNAARNLLPTGLPSNPSYRKVNPADAPIMILSLTSDSMTQGQMYDAADTILAQKLSQVTGVGQVSVGGSSQPAVRVELNPTALNKYGIGSADVRTAIAATNANRPKGVLEDGDKNWQIYANDQAKTAAEYMPLIVAYRNGAAVRVSDVATVIDSVANVRNAGSANGKPSVLVILNRQPGANIIETVDDVRALLPQLRASIPAAINLDVVLDRTPTIRASLQDTEKTLLMSIGLVIMVVFLFLRNGRATFIPAVAVPVSLIGTFGVMYLLGYSLDNLSLMALTIATGFVVDDAIVVLENVSRHIEAGKKPFAAAMLGAREVGFTVLSMSISLIAVFIPILLMGGIVGRLFREFAVTLSVAILVSLLVSLTTTPMMCARLLKHEPHRKQGRFFNATERAFDAMLRGYERSLAWALRFSPLMMLILFGTIVLNIYLYTVIPKGFFPQQDTGLVIGGIQGDQSISFQSMKVKLNEFVDIVRKDPDVQSVIAFTGGGQSNRGNMFITLKPLTQRKLTADKVIARLRGKLSHVPGANLFMQSVQDIRVGGRSSDAQYQYTLQADDLNELRTWEPKIRDAMTALPQLADVNTDQQDKGLQTTLTIDRETAIRSGVTPQLIDSTLNDLFGQRQVSTIYSGMNQYHVVMEAAPQYWQSSQILHDTYVSIPASTANLSPTTSALGTPPALTAGGKLASNSSLALTLSTSAEQQMPLAAFSSFQPTSTSLAVNHQSQFIASTISFNLPPGVSLSEATLAINDTMARIGVPTSVHGSFQGTANVFQSSLNSQPVLILTALLAVYIVLGVLYESYVHPITIISTLPSAGVGALLALLATGTDFSLIALIGVILLIGIVKKNAIMMIDFALHVEREQGLSPRDSIFEACKLRFRPIMMTTMAAMLGALPLALGAGNGAELRRPLGIAIVGGLIMSQLLTLYTTPVVYLYMDRFRLWSKDKWERRGGRPAPDVAEAV